MTVDLATILIGHARTPNVSGRELLKASCPCGKIIARVHYEDDGITFLATSARRLTRAHTGIAVYDTALEDMETLLNQAQSSDVVGADKDLETIMTFLEVTTPELLAHLLPPLELPPRPVLLAGLMDIDPRTPPDMPLEPLDATCRRCRKVYYLGRDLTEWMHATNQARHIVVETLHDYRTLNHPQFPQAALGSRLRLYKHALTAIPQRRANMSSTT